MRYLVCFLCLIPLLGFSQERQIKEFSFDYFSGYYSNFKEWKENGLTGGIQFSYKNKFVYSTNLLLGFGFSKNINNKNGYIQAFLESDILIGKEINLSNAISILPQIGIGYLHYTNHFQEDKQNLIGFPVHLKILLFNNNSVAFGLIPRVNFNNVQNNYALVFAINLK